MYPCDTSITMPDIVIVLVRRKIAPNCLQKRCSVSKQHHVMFHRLYLVISLLFQCCSKVPRLKTHTNSYIKTAILIYANIMLGLPVVTQIAVGSVAFIRLMNTFTFQTFTRFFHSFSCRHRIIAEGYSILPKRPIL